jgi:hypothetical protein
LQRTVLSWPDINIKQLNPDNWWFIVCDKCHLQHRFCRRKFWHVLHGWCCRGTANKKYRPLTLVLYRVASLKKKELYRVFIWNLGKLTVYYRGLCWIIWASTWGKSLEIIGHFSKFGHNTNITKESGKRERLLISVVSLINVPCLSSQKNLKMFVDI